MNSFCTYCSATKRDEPGEIPAIHRYQSARIDNIYSAACLLGVEFYILSGEFGLIPPERTIPWYDHLLKPEEASVLADRIVGQIRQHGITTLIYFTQPLAQEPHALPYHDAIAVACSRATAAFCVIEMRV
jgi:hypothetical protein